MGLNWYANLPKPLGRKSVGTPRQPTIMPRLGGPEAFAQMTALRPDLPAIFTTGHSNLRLVETLAQFRTRLRARGNVLEVAERQRVVRLLVHEIFVSSDNITIRHSIPLPTSSPDPNHGVRPSHEPPEPNTGPNYLLRSHGQYPRDNVSSSGLSWSLNLGKADLISRRHQIV